MLRGPVCPVLRDTMMSLIRSRSVKSGFHMTYKGGDSKEVTYECTDGRLMLSYDGESMVSDIVGLTGKSLVLLYEEDGFKVTYHFSK